MLAYRMLKWHTWEQYLRLCGHTMRLVFVRRRCESTWMITKQEDWGCTFSATPCQSRLPPLCKRASAWRQQISPTAAVALCSIQMPWATLQIDNQLPARGAQNAPHEEEGAKKNKGDCSLLKNQPTGRFWFYGLVFTPLDCFYWFYDFTSCDCF